MILPKENCTYLNRNYNVEYFEANGKVMSFNANMVNIDKTYFYFEDIIGGLNMIRQEDIRSIACKPIEYHDKTIHHSGDYNKGYKLGRIDGEDFGYNRALNELEDWMCKQFGGGDPEQDRSKIFKHILDMKKPIDAETSLKGSVERESAGV